VLAALVEEALDLLAELGKGVGIDGARDLSVNRSSTPEGSVDEGGFEDGPAPEKSVADRG
jgi:hypothetical protein